MSDKILQLLALPIRCEYQTAGGQPCSRSDAGAILTRIADAKGYDVITWTDGADPIGTLIAEHMARALNSHDRLVETLVEMVGAYREGFAAENEPSAVRDAIAAIDRASPRLRADLLRQGDVLVADDGFTCVKAGDRLRVEHGIGGLYFLCRDGRHYLSGQTDDDGCLVGLERDAEEQ